jgi:hypothetical protein
MPLIDFILDEAVAVAETETVPADKASPNQESSGAAKGEKKKKERNKENAPAETAGAKTEKPKKEKQAPAAAPAELAVWHPARLDLRVGRIVNCKVIRFGS